MVREGAEIHACGRLHRVFLIPGGHQFLDAWPIAHEGAGKLTQGRLEVAEVLAVDLGQIHHLLRREIASMLDARHELRLHTLRLHHLDDGLVKDILVVGHDQLCCHFLIGRVCELDRAQILGRVEIIYRADGYQMRPAQIRCRRLRVRAHDSAQLRPLGGRLLAHHAHGDVRNLLECGLHCAGNMVLKVGRAAGLLVFGGLDPTQKVLDSRGPRRSLRLIAWVGVHLEQLQARAPTEQPARRLAQHLVRVRRKAYVDAQELELRERLAIDVVRC